MTGATITTDLMSWLEKVVDQSSLSCHHRTKNTRSLLQLGNRAFCVAGPVAWNSRLPLDIRSAPTLSTFKNMFICSLVPTSLTNCRPEYEQRTLYSARVVTLAVLLRLINCRFIILLQEMQGEGVIYVCVLRHRLILPYTTNTSSNSRRPSSVLRRQKPGTVFRQK